MGASHIPALAWCTELIHMHVCQAWKKGSKIGLHFNEDMLSLQAGPSFEKLDLHIIPAKKITKIPNNSRINSKKFQELSRKSKEVKLP